MPAQATTSVFGNKPLSKRILEAREKPAVPDSGGGLPAGIETGIAKLISCKFQKIKEGSQNAGKIIFLARGVVVAPESHNGVPVKGRQTSIIENMFDTPGKSRATFDDHVEWVTNMLKCLGADTSGITMVSDLEQVAKDLEDAGPYFTFRTWAGKSTKEYPNPRTNETWGQVCAYEPAPGETPVETGVTDDTPPVDEPAPEDAPADEPAADAGEEPDLDAILKAANAAKDTPAKAAAQKQLEEIAKERGIDDDAVANAANWEEVVELIKAAGGEGEPAAEEEATEDAAYEPAKGDVVKYGSFDPKTKKPITDPKTKKPKLVEYEIVLVDKKKSAVTLKNLDTGKMLLADDGKSARLVPNADLVVTA